MNEQKAVYRWILDPIDRDAVLANVAIRKSETDYKVIIETACVLNPEELLAIRRAYQTRFKRSFEEDVAAHTTGDLRKVIFFYHSSLYLFISIFTLLRHNFWYTLHFIHY